MEVIATGQIRGAFGLDGFVKVESFSGEYRHFPKLEKVFVAFPESKLKELKLADGWFEIENVKLRAADALLKIKGIDTPENAKSFSGAVLSVPRDMASPLKKGEFYIHDLCNCVLVYGETLVGKITSIAEGGGGYLLETLEAASGRTVYIPFNKEFIGNIDLKKRTVELMHLWILE